MTPTNIEWTHYSWGLATGCTKVSPGCLNCYSERESEWLQHIGNPRYRNGFTPTAHPDRLDEPLNVQEPSLVFPCSMSDICHPAFPDDLLHAAFRMMHRADRHVYQLLTKRPWRLAELSLPWADHIWAGTSVENDEEIGSSGYRPTDRIDDLRRSGATVKWISAEPLLGPLPDLDLAGIDWVVVGGESGPIDDIREMKLDWARDLVEQCRAQDVPVFVKQLGTVWARKNGHSGKGGDPAKWPKDLRVRQQPTIFEGQPELG